MSRAFEGNLDGQNTTRPGDGVLAIAVVPFPGHAELVAVLAALAPKAQVRALRDLDALVELSGAQGRLVVDVDHVALEDIGWVKRILAARPGWSVVCTGRDAGARNGRALLAVESSRWLSWPPSLDDLRALTTAPRALAAPVTQPAPAAAGPSAGPVAASTPPASSSPPSASSAGGVSGSASGSGSTSGSGPALGREHVAVLADISQRLELAFAALRESGRLSEPEMESPSIELRRLLRFTRTLSCLVSPPPRGDEEFDLAALIEEQLAALTLRARKGPRFQPRASQEGRPVEFVVKADRAALALAFEALLQLARHCAGQGETVRVVYATPQPSELSVRIEFPAGPLERLTNEQLADPAVLRDRLPELWPSDVSAAAAILASQGGQLQIHSGPNGHVTLLARLTGVRSQAPGAAPRAGQSQTSAAASGSRAGADDPFA